MGKPTLRGSRAFTLTELLVVIALLAILLVLLLPVVSKAREHAWTSTCATQMRQVYLAVIAYANDNHGALPKPPPINGDTGRLPYSAYAWTMPAAGVADFNTGTLVNYLGPSPESRARMMRCPADVGTGRSAWDIPTPRNFTYALNAFINHRSADGPALRTNQLRNPGGKILVWEMRAAYDGIVCFCGGADVSPDKLADWHSGKGNHVFADGHVELLRSRDVMNNESYYYLTNDEDDCGTHWPQN